MYNFFNNPYLKNLPKIKNKENWEKYIKFISSISFSNCSSSKREKHHIVPKAYLVTTLEKNDKENLISLSLREHYEAHRLLWLTFDDDYMTSAFWRMSHSNQNGQLGWISAEEYEKLRRRNQLIAQNRSQKSRWIKKDGKNRRISIDRIDEFLMEGWTLGRYRSPDEVILKQKNSRILFWEKHPERKKEYSEARKGEKNPFYGKKHSEASMEKIIAANRIQTLARKTCKKKVAEKLNGRIRINKGEMELSIKKEELDAYLSEGWTCGLKKTHKTNKDRTIINNGSNEKLIPKEDISLYLQEGWTLGRKPFSEEHRKKLSEKNKNRISWSKGKKLKEEQKIKCREARKEQSLRYREAKNKGFVGSWNEFCHKEKCEKWKKINQEK